MLLSYAAMTVIPVILFAIIASTLISLYVNDRLGGGGAPAFWQASMERSDLIAGVEFVTRMDPDRLDDPDFLTATDGQLNSLQAGLVVMIDGRTIYASPLADHADLTRQLPGIQADTSPHRWGRPWTDSSGFTVDKFDFTLHDHRQGSVYVLSDQNAFLSFAKTFFPLLLLSLLVVVGLTNGALTYFVSRSLVRPLRALKAAAERFREGDLSQEVKLRRQDEIGELGAAIESMRLRLNESIHLQLQYEDNRKELISSISHDLKTPISSIQACVEGIRDGIADSKPKLDKYMGMIARKTGEMDRLIDELFLFSKLDLKRLPFHLEATDLAKYLEDAVRELRLEPRLAGVTVTFVCSGDPPIWVMADREKLHRVLMNIIDNSLKYSNDPSRPLQLSLGLRDEGDQAAVSVADNGPGVEAEALPFIFDRFYRADPSRNAATGGSGLGLAIVKQIIEGQGGQVRAASVLGQGTTITFALPKMKDGGDRDEAHSDRGR